MKKNRVEHLIDFLVIGARLSLIKSRALLPKIPTLPGDEEEEEDPAEALIRQLRQYKRFKQAAQLALVNGKKLVCAPICAWHRRPKLDTRSGFDRGNGGEFDNGRSSRL